MCITEQVLLAFFEKVAQKDKVQLKKLKDEKSFSIRAERWCFTLPDLFVFLGKNNNIFRYSEYSQFRKLIFNSPIHRAVKLYGAEITITDNLGNVDKSSYALVWPNVA